MDERPVVLVVDDDPRNRAVMQGFLENDYQVIEAADGPEALAAVAERPIDLVLLDVMMPGMSGLEVCRHLKARPPGPFLPVLLVTAAHEPEDRHAGFEAGADDFLAKPYDRRELLLRVRAFLRTRRQDRLIRRQFDELRQLGALKDDLFALIAHDLRNPLAGISGFLQVLHDEVEDPLLRDDLRDALRTAGKMQETLEDLLQVRMLEEGKLTLELKPESLGPLAAAAVSSVKGAALDRGVGIELDAPADLVAPASAKMLRRALENLVLNAIKYSPSGASVAVSVRARNGEVELDVADRGPGVPDPLKSALFEKFGSVEAKRGEQRRGHGLGLYMVKLVATAHGGRVEAHDRDGGGTLFRLTLPASA